MKKGKKDINEQKIISNIYTKIASRVSKFREQIRTIREERNLQLNKTMIVRKEKKNTPVIVQFSGVSVAKSAAIVVLVLISFYFLYMINGILLSIFIAFLFAAALDPLVDYLQRLHVPRALSVILIYILLLIFLGYFATNFVGLIASQTVEIAQNIGSYITNLTQQNAHTPFASYMKPYLDQFYKTIDLQTAAIQVQNALQIVGGQLLSISIGLINLIIVLVLTFFMTVEEKALERFYKSLFPVRYGEYISTRLEAVKDQIGYWLRGQVLVSVVCGIITYIGLSILGVNYALTLSVIAGISMVIPVIGRVFAWILAFPIVFNQSPMLSLWMSIFYLILQQIEVNILVPYIMNRAVGLNPLIIMIAMLIGGQFLGILGLVLSIPIATTVAIFFRDYTSRERAS